MHLNGAHVFKAGTSKYRSSERFLNIFSKIVIEVIGDLNTGVTSILLLILSYSVLD